MFTYALRSQLLFPFACQFVFLVRQNLKVMSPSRRRPIALHNAIPNVRRRLHPISMLLALLLRKPIMRSIKRQIRNTLVPLNPRRLLQTASKIPRNLAENGDLALDDVFFAAGAHVARDVLDEALFGGVVHDFVPEGAGGVEVFRADFGEEGYGAGDEVGVDFVEVWDNVLAALHARSLY